MNKADSSSIRNMLIEKGMKPAEKAEEADALILNTCAVRQHAENRIYGRLGYYRHVKETQNPGMTIVLTGCLSRFSKERLIGEYEVDVIADVYSQQELVELLSSRKSAVAQIFKNDGYIFKKSYLDEQNPNKAFLSITHGCDNRCSYCIVPSVRGPMISRPEHEIEEELKRLIDAGVKEVTLLGQNVNSYGEDINAVSFPGLLQRLDNIAQSHSDELWIRFLTSHPKDFSKGLADALIELPSVCEQLHLPLQSGNNRVLQSMRRKYSREDYMERVDYLRSRDASFPLSTDVLVGFDMETDTEFEETMDILQRVAFEDAYMYRYSERAGSIAAQKKVPYDEAKSLERLNELVRRQREIAHERLKSLVGMEMRVMAEHTAKDGEHILARSRGYRMALLPKGAAKPGDILNVKTTGLKGSAFSAVPC